MIGFMRNDQEFDPKPEREASTFAHGLDFDRMWDEGLTSTSLEWRTARREFER